VRRLSVILLGGLVLGAATAGAQCDLTGEWEVSTTLGYKRMNLRDDPVGTLVGTMYDEVFGAGTAVPVTGAHTGFIDITLTIGGNVATGRLVTCEGMSLTYTVTGEGFGANRMRTSYCGDGVVDAFTQEVCDDGNFANDDDCTVACKVATCGDGVLRAGEQCDDGNIRNGDGCSNTCQTNVCGNGVIEPGETCDDGNTTGGDGCTQYCQNTNCSLSGTWYGGFQFSEYFSIREDAQGNLSGTDISSSPVPFSGTRTGETLSLTFALSPPFTVPGTVFSCDLLDLTPFHFERVSDTYCGDGVVQPGERCDDGNFVDADDCSVACQLTHCGDGALDPFEGCDDGNVTAGDGCSARCAVEHPLTGARLVLRDRPDTRKRKLVVDSRDRSLSLGNGNGGADDPVLHGASLRVVTADGCAGPCTADYDLPAAHWSYVGAAADGRGYAYSDRDGGPIKRVSVRAGRRLKVLGGGSLLKQALAAAPEPVHVVLRFGSAVYCMEFGGTTRLQPGKTFSAVGAPATACPPD
jgi:cysteine-rich repeat protein